MKQAIKKMSSGANAAVVFLALLALVVSGAGSAERLYDGYADFIQSAERIELQGPILEKAPDGEGPANMDTGSKPDCEPPAYLQSSPIVKPDNNEKRDDLTQGSGGTVNTVPGRLNSKNSLRSSASMISSSLGKQFTQVGAKPSGTS